MHTRLREVSVLATIFRILAAALLLAACERPAPTPAPESRPEVKAPDLIGDSFVVLPSETAPYVGIKKAALDKEFILKTKLLYHPTAEPNAEIHGLKTRIVAFSQRGGQLVMLEASTGHLYYDEFPETLILASFPILAEGSDVLLFDFNASMSQLFHMSDMATAATAHPGYGEHFASAPIARSFLQAARLKDSNGLDIVQALQLYDHPALVPAQAHYRLEPYRPNPNYVPKLSPQSNYVGFLAVSPTLAKESKRAVTFVRRFDPSKPIVFAISANTPPPYRQAIREGALYWNRYLGADRIRVIDAPAGVHAPTYDYNLIQWVSWEGSTYAYADSQADPRTGEILHAQIVVPDSVVSRQSLLTASALLASEANREASKAKTRRLGVRGFDDHLLCAHHSKPTGELLTHLAHDDLTDDKLLQAAQDSLRHSIAHEVGHVLGLRHNFAGGLAASYDVAQRSDLVTNYLTRGTLPDGVHLNSTVMDYPDFAMDLMIGQQIAAPQTRLAYDRMAVAILYDDLEAADFSERPLFCTDEDLGRYVDCRQHAMAKNPFAAAKGEGKARLRQLPALVFSWFIGHVKAPGRDAKRGSWDHIDLPAKNYAWYVIEPKYRALQALQKDQRAITIDGRVSAVSDNNREALDEQYAAWLRRSLAEEGGWPEVLGYLPGDLEAYLNQAFADLVASPRLQRGHGPGGFYELSSDDLNQMRASFARYSKELAKETQRLDLAALAAVEEFSSRFFDAGTSKLGEDFAQYLADHMATILFAKDTHPLTSLLRIKVPAQLTGHEDIALMQMLLQAKGRQPQFLWPVDDGKRLLPDYELRAHCSKSLQQSLATWRQGASDHLAQLPLDRFYRDLAEAISARVDMARESGVPTLQSNDEGVLYMYLEEWRKQPQLRLPSALADDYFQTLLAHAPTDVGLDPSYTDQAGLNSIFRGVVRPSLAVVETPEDAPATPPEGLLPLSRPVVGPNKGLQLKAEVPVALYVPVHLTRFTHSFALRLQAVKTLTALRRDDKIQLAARTRLALHKALQKVVTQDLRALEADSTEQLAEVNLWLQEQQMLLMTLENKTSGDSANASKG